jgi:signal transduction histidine kinase
VEYDVLEERVQHRTKELHSANCSLREREHRLETLSRELLNAQETERRNLARELHDEIGQLLTVIKMHLRSAQRKSDDVVTKDLDQAVQTIDDTINQVRSLSLRLRPSVLDDLGLIPALEWQADQVLEKTGIQVLTIAVRIGNGILPRRPGSPDKRDASLTGHICVDPAELLRLQDDDDNY